MADKPNEDLQLRGLEESETDHEKLLKERFGFVFGVCNIAQRLDFLESQGEPYIIGINTGKLISDILCQPFLPSADDIAENEREIVYKALLNIISKLKKMQPDISEAVECATLDLLEGLKEKIRSSEIAQAGRDKLTKALSDSMSGGKEVLGKVIEPDGGNTIGSVVSQYADNRHIKSPEKSHVEAFAERTIDQLKKGLDELRNSEKFDDLSNDSKMIILGAGPHTYNDFIKWCGDDVIDEYYRLICQIHALAEEKKGALYIVAFKKPLERLIEFLRQEEEKRRSKK